MHDKTFLGKGSVLKLIIKLSIPTIIAQLVNLLYNIVDRIYIGNIKDVGGLAFTAVGVCMPVILVVSAFAALVGYGGAPKSTIYLGKKEDEKAEIVVGNSFTLLLVFGIILTIVLLIFSKPLLYLFGASDNTIGYANDYLVIYAIGTVFVMMALGMNAFISAQGFTKISMVSVLIGAILNCILDPIFIFAFSMGVKGAAIATIISQAVSAVYVVWFLQSDKALVRLKWKNLLLKWNIILPTLALGLSPFVMQFTEAVITVCFNASLKKYGGDIAVGAMTTLASLMQFSMLPLMGLSQGAQPVTSYNYGAKNADRVKKSFIILLIASVIYSTVFWLSLMLFPKGFASIFLNAGEVELINYTAWAIRIYFAISCLFGIQIACQQTFIAIGNAKVSLFLAVLRKVILLIPLIFILPSIINNKVMAVYLAEPIADGIAVSVTIILFLIYFKKALKKLKQEALLESTN